jgi:hypothetical protein
MKYCESRIHLNGTRQTFISFGDSCIDISENLTYGDTFISTVYGAYLPEPPFVLQDNQVLVTGYGCPVVLNKSML